MMGSSRSSKSITCPVKIKNAVNRTRLLAVLGQKRHVAVFAVHLFGVIFVFPDPIVLETGRVSTWVKRGR
jgi:hypothetical protein